MTAASYLLTLGTAVCLVFLLVLAVGIGLHACRLRRLGFNVVRENDHG